MKNFIKCWLPVILMVILIALFSTVLPAQGFPLTNPVSVPVNTGIMGQPPAANSLVINFDSLHNQLKFQDEGSTLGTPQIKTINYVGSGVTATRSGNTATITIPTVTISTLSSTLAIGGALSMTTATPRNIDTLVLTAGTWLVSGNVNFSESAATTTAHSAGITTTSETIPTDGTQVYSNTQSILLSGIDGITLPSKVVIVATGTTNVYLVGSTTFSAGTSSGFGSILAWKL